MKLLFDANISFRLSAALADIYPGSLHVDACNLQFASDDVIWEYAKQNGFTIVSKDSDFYDRTLLLGSPPKLIWLRVGNCSTVTIENLLRSFHSDIEIFIKENTGTCLQLSVH
jgi:predicted nuclease of predicted toxin-antitoxin system